MTSRLLMKAADARHSDTLNGLAANPRVAENLAVRPANAPRGGAYAVLERGRDAAIGLAAFGAMMERRDMIEIAVWIGEPYWGRGFATEATQALIDHAFQDGKLNIVWCSSRVRNTRARRVIEKCGFQFRDTGMMRAVGGAIPVERFILERRNWQSLKAWGARNGAMEDGDAPRDNAA
jgi:RimJ/RimL family protein N-acetyltransferase